MTWAFVVLGTPLVAAVAVTAIVSPVKVAVGLLGTGVIVSTIILVMAVTSSPGSSGPMVGFSYAQLEADRIMTQQMASVVGPGMDSLMTTNGMLERSANDAYLRALERHAYEVDRMLGRTL